MKESSDYSNGDVLKYNSTSDNEERQLQNLKEEHSYQKDLKMMDQDHDKSMLVLQRGWIGSLFGIEQHAVRNMAVVILLILMLAVFIIAGVAYWGKGDKAFVEELFKYLIPVVTLTLGYLFGKNK